MATIYVSTAGNDTTGNGSSETPWASLKKAVDAGSSNTIEFKEAAGSYTMAADINGAAKTGIVIHGNSTVHSKAESTVHALKLGNGFSLSDIEIRSAGTASGDAAIAVANTTNAAGFSETFSGVIATATGIRQGFFLSGVSAITLTSCTANGEEYGLYIDGLDPTNGDGGNIAGASFTATGGTFTTGGAYHLSGSAGVIADGINGTLTSCTLHGQIDEVDAGDFASGVQAASTYGRNVYTLTNCTISATRASYAEHPGGLGDARAVFAQIGATIILYGGTITSTCPSGAYDLWADSTGCIYVRSDVAYSAAKTNTTNDGTIGVIAAPTLSAYTTTSVTIAWAGVTGGGRTPITSQLQQSEHGADTWSDVTGATSSPATVAELTEGTTYDFRVKLTDADSTVLYTTTLAATPGAFSGAAGLMLAIGIL